MVIRDVFLYEVGCYVSSSRGLTVARVGYIRPLRLFAKKKVGYVRPLRMRRYGGAGKDKD